MPYPPGGGTDVIARIVQDRLRAALGQSDCDRKPRRRGWVYRHRSRGRSAPDGYTVLFTLSSHTINPAIFSKLSFDTARDFEPIGMVCSLPQILVANPQFPANTVAAADRYGQGKAGLAGITHQSVMARRVISPATDENTHGTQLTHIPYRGGGPAVTDVVSGQVPLLWVSIPAAAQFVKQKQLKALAVSTLKRSAAFPDVPTMQESASPTSRSTPGTRCSYPPKHRARLSIDSTQR